MIKFSIILNSRGRTNLLLAKLKCIEQHTNDLSSIEVIANFDTDDLESISCLSTFHTKFPFFRSTVFKREYNVHTNINKLAELSTGEFIWPMGDDCHIMTKDWDVIAYNKFQDFFKTVSKKVAIGAVESTSVDKNIGTGLGWYCDAPIFSRECIKALGFLVHPHFISLGADVATYTIYNWVNRVIDMREIVFDHVTHNTIQKVINPDKTAFEYRQRQQKHQALNPFDRDYSKEIGQLQRYLNE
jgi:hypothetical protein